MSAQNTATKKACFNFNDTINKQKQTYKNFQSSNDIQSSIQMLWSPYKKPIRKGYVKQIIGKMQVSTSIGLFTFYLIRWKGHPIYHSTWQYPSIFKQITEKIVSFNKMLMKISARLPYLDQQYMSQCPQYFKLMNRFTQSFLRRKIDKKTMLNFMVQKQKIQNNEIETNYNNSSDDSQAQLHYNNLDEKVSDKRVITDGRRLKEKQVAKISLEKASILEVEQILDPQFDAQQQIISSNEPFKQQQNPQLLDSNANSLFKNQTEEKLLIQRPTKFKKQKPKNLEECRQFLEQGQIQVFSISNPLIIQNYKQQDISYKQINELEQKSIKAQPKVANSKGKRVRSKQKRSKYKASNRQYKSKQQLDIQLKDYFQKQKLIQQLRRKLLKQKMNSLNYE